MNPDIWLFAFPHLNINNGLNSLVVSHYAHVIFFDKLIIMKKNSNLKFVFFLKGQGRYTVWFSENETKFEIKNN